MINPEEFLKGIIKVKRAGTKFGKAPHKPILLITLLELIDKGIVIDNCFHIDADLVGIFQENWRLLVETAHQPDFTQPFYYLQSDKILGLPFWQIHTNTKQPLHAHVKSVDKLSRLVDFASFSFELYVILQHVEHRTLFLNTLLNHFFPNTAKNYRLHKNLNDGFYKIIQSLVLNEQEGDVKRIELVSEEDVFVRSNLFKRYIPQLYNDTCAVTGMQIRSTYNYNFVDACHIVPFSISHDDRVTNGLALCPNIHRAFDRGLLGIDSNYRIQVSSSVKDDTQHPYSLKSLANRQIILPNEEKFYPSKENLEWHFKEVFKL